MPGGRPLNWKTPEELQKEIDLYFETTPKDEWTITGLALALNTYRQTLLYYEERDEFYDTVKKAKQRIENGYELDLKKHGRTGTIFALKNFDWKDKSETDVTTKGESLNLITPEDKLKLNNLLTRKQDESNTPSTPEGN